MSQRSSWIGFDCRFIVILFVSVFFYSPTYAATDEQPDLRALLAQREFKSLDDAVLNLEKAFTDGTLSERQFGRKFAPLYEAPAELEPTFNDWIATSSQPVLARIARGSFYLTHGWRARGDKFMSQTSSQKIERMTTYFNQSKTDFDAVLAQKPDCSLCYGPLVSIAGALGERKHKTEMFQKAIKLNPKSYWAVTAYFSFLSPKWGGAPNEAQEFLQWFRKNYPNNPAIPVIEADLLIDKVDDYAARGEHQSAQPLVQRALALDPLHPRAWTMQSWILDKANDFPGALSAAENAIKNGADDDWTLAHHASLLFKLGRIEEGIQAFEQAVDGPIAFRAGLQALVGNVGKQKPDYPRTWEYCQRGMQAGLPEAFACTGTFYYFGWLKPVDYAEAFKWWKVAADRGVPESMVDIGIMYWDGQGTPHNKDQAIEYWIKGAQAGDARGVGKLQAHLTPWEFYTQYTLPNFQREFILGEAGDSPTAIFSRLVRITWDGPIGKWTLTWVLPIMLSLLLLVLLLLRRERHK